VAGSLVGDSVYDFRIWHFAPAHLFDSSTKRRLHLGSLAADLLCEIKRVLFLFNIR